MNTKLGMSLVVIAIVVLAGALWYGEEFHERDVPQNPAISGQPELANPASVNCVRTLGGTLEIKEEVNGEAGYCHLPDGRVCEEWGLFRDSACTPPPAAPASRAATGTPPAQ